MYSKHTEDARIMTSDRADSVDVEAILCLAILSDGTLMRRLIRKGRLTITQFLFLPQEGEILKLIMKE